MENEQQMTGEKKDFFGSKLNTALLFVLIVLVIAAIVLIMKNDDSYSSTSKVENTSVVQTENFEEKKSNTQLNQTNTFSISKAEIGKSLPGFSILQTPGYTIRKVMKDNCGTDCWTDPYLAGIMIYQDSINDIVGEISYLPKEEEKTCKDEYLPNTSFSYRSDEVVNNITYRKYTHARAESTYYCTETKNGEYLVINSYAENQKPFLVDLGSLKFEY